MLNCEDRPQRRGSPPVFFRTLALRPDSDPPYYDSWQTTLPTPPENLCMFELLPSSPPRSSKERATARQHRCEALRERPLWPRRRAN